MDSEKFEMDICTIRPTTSAEIDPTPYWRIRPSTATETDPTVYDKDSLIDSEEFVPEIATPQELKVEVIQEEIE